MKSIVWPLLLLAAAAYANDASFVGDGATVYANSESRVRMVREKIRIAFDQQGANQRRWRADCEFEFENLTDQPVELTMGFPNWQAFGDDVGTGLAIRDFTTEIDGRKIPTESKLIKEDKLAAPWKAPGTMPTFEAAIVWPVEVGPKARLIVKNRFAFGGFISNGPFNVLEQIGPPTYPRIHKEHKFWSARKPGERDIDFENSLVGAVAYITTTGLTWKGPIDEAEISIEVPPFLRKNPHYLIPLPVGFRLEADRVIWRFKDYRPKEEVALYFLTAVPIPEGDSQISYDVHPRGFEYREQAEAWVRFVSKGQVAPEVLDRLIAISREPAAEVLAKFKERTAPK